MQCKIFCAIRPKELELYVNEWLKENPISPQSMKFQYNGVGFDAADMTEHTLVLFYEAEQKPVERVEDEEPQCECGLTIEWLNRFFGWDQEGHIVTCEDCGMPTLHMSDDSSRCLSCGKSGGVDAEGNVYVNGEIASNGGKSIDQLRGEYFDGHSFMIG